MPYEESLKLIQLAQHHFGELDRQIDEWAATLRPVLRHRHHIGTGLHTLILENITDPPASCTQHLLEFGAALRGALNTCVRTIAAADGTQPHYLTGFPIVLSADDEAKLLEATSDVHPVPAKMIADLQPYRRPGKPGTAELVLLARIAGETSSALRAVALVTPHGERAFAMESGGVSVRRTSVSAPEVTQRARGAVLIEMHFVPPDAEIEFKFSPERPPIIDVGFDDGGGAIEYPQLLPIVGEVQRIVEVLKPWVSPPKV